MQVSRVSFTHCSILLATLLTAPMGFSQANPGRDSSATTAKEGANQTAVKGDRNTSKPGSTMDQAGAGATTRSTEAASPSESTRSGTSGTPTADCPPAVKGAVVDPNCKPTRGAKGSGADTTHSSHKDMKQ